MGTLPRHAVAALVLVAPLCAASFWSKKKAAEAPVVPAVRIADCRYEKLAYREGGSRVECFRWGERARLCGVRIVARPETRPRPAAQVHASRILPGHFGHDMLNNYLVFNTIWELNLAHWMDWGKLRHVVDDAVRSKLGEQLVETMQYSRAEQPSAGMRSWAATALAELIFRRSSPSRLKKVFWRDYRDMFARKFCAGCDHRQATRPLRGRCPAKKLNVVLTRRTHDPASSRVMFANGRGRRILNNDALAKALGAFGRVRNVDRAHALGDQIRLMMSAGVLVSRMARRLYYDHASTFEELAEIFDHGFSRTTHRVDDQAGVPPQAVVGNARKCKSQCSGPPEFRKYQGEDVIARCEARVVLCDGMQFPPKLVNVADEIKGKKVLIMGLPGAFTPC
ncbi:hypothetical protein JL721_9307 [Aureococcus anophagefferens]|nr:hypothetical protein JL721_9307 [Aureococcus anophagefferens]